MKLILLPGMDGTGELFSDLCHTLARESTPVIVRYPSDKKLSFYDLAELVQGDFPIDEKFVIIAESFSVPVAIICAAKNLVNLKALVLCAGFATSPIKGASRYIGYLLAPILLRLPLPGVMYKIWLIGRNTDSMLLSKVKNIVSSMRKNILIDRVNSVFNCDVIEEIGKIKIPILYIRAKNDRLISKSCYNEIKNASSNVELVEINGPHFILQKEPIKSAKIIMKFIENV